MKNITNWIANNESIHVLNLPFENNGEDVNGTKDYSSYSNDATENGGVVYNSTGGYDGFGAYEFDGDGDFITIPASNSLNFNGKDFTLSAWVKTERTGDDGLHLRAAGSGMGLSHRGIRLRGLSVHRRYLLRDFLCPHRLRVRYGRGPAFAHGG